MALLLYFPPDASRLNAQDGRRMVFPVASGNCLGRGNRERGEEVIFRVGASTTPGGFWGRVELLLVDFGGGFIFASKLEVKETGYVRRCKEAVRTPSDTERSH